MEIPESVTAIGDNAFTGCISLIAINVNSNNHYFNSIDGVQFTKDGKTLIQYPAEKSGSYIVPGVVTTIEQSAFYNCDSLSSVEIPEGVTTIGDNAFKYCASLKDLYLKALTPPSTGTDCFYSVSGCTLHLKSVAAGYDVAPWTTTSKFSSIVYNL